MIGRIPAHDPDLLDSLNYTFLHGNELQLLLLDPASGELQLSPDLNNNRPLEALMEVSVSGEWPWGLRGATWRAAGTCPEPARLAGAQSGRARVALGICGLRLDGWITLARDALLNQAKRVRGAPHCCPQRFCWEQSWASSSSRPGLPGLFSECLAPELCCKNLVSGYLSVRLAW